MCQAQTISKCMGCIVLLNLIVRPTLYVLLASSFFPPLEEEMKVQGCGVIGTTL